MPTMTLVCWNIEVYGDRRPATRGDYLAFNLFIANVLNEVAADVFIMMELRSGGIPHLDTLRAAIATATNSNWSYDYIPGAVADGEVRPIQNNNQLGFAQDAHGEGYAVFWKNDAARFTLQQTGANLSARNDRISLVLEGRSPQTYQPITQYFTAPAFNPAANPYPSWGDLDFPIPSPAGVRPDTTQGFNRLTKSRRPCYCILELNKPGAANQDKLLPIVVYHSPNVGNSRWWATELGIQLSGYARQLYQPDRNATTGDVLQAIVAGDFNQELNNGAVAGTPFSVYTLSYPFGGAGCTNIWVNDTVTPLNNQTCVRLKNRGNVAIVSANPLDYRMWPIDNLFFANVAGANGQPNIQAVLPAGAYHGPVYDLITAVMQGGSLVNSAAKQNVIKFFALELDDAYENGDYNLVNPTNGTPAKKRQKIGTAADGTSIYKITGDIIPDLQNYDAYVTDLWAGEFTSARTAAEFICNSISDHLPLVFRFQF